MDRLLALGAAGVAPRRRKRQAIHRVQRVTARIKRDMDRWDAVERAGLVRDIEVCIVTYDPRRMDPVITTVADLDALRSVYRLCFGPQVQVRLRAPNALPDPRVDELSRRGYRIDPNAGGGDPQPKNRPSEAVPRCGYR